MNSRISLKNAINILTKATADLKKKLKVNSDQVSEAVDSINFNLANAKQAAATGIKCNADYEKELANAQNILNEYEEIKDAQDQDALDQFINDTKDKKVSIGLSLANKYFENRLSPEDLNAVLIKKQIQLKNLNSNKDKRKFEDEIVALREEIESITIEIDSINRKGDDIETGKESLRKAFANYKYVLSIAEKPEAKCEAYIGIGRCYHAQGMLKEAGEYYKKAYNMKLMTTELKKRAPVNVNFFDKYAKSLNSQYGSWNVKIEINPTVPDFITKPELPPDTLRMDLISYIQANKNKNPGYFDNKNDSLVKLTNFLHPRAKNSKITFKPNEIDLLSQGEVGNILKNHIRNNVKKMQAILPPELFNKLNKDIKHNLKITARKK